MTGQENRKARAASAGFKNSCRCRRRAASQTRWQRRKRPQRDPIGGVDGQAESQEQTCHHRRQIVYTLAGFFISLRYPHSKNTEAATETSTIISARRPKYRAQRTEREEGTEGHPALRCACRHHAYMRRGGYSQHSFLIHLLLLLSRAPSGIRLLGGLGARFFLRGLGGKLRLAVRQECVRCRRAGQTNVQAPHSMQSVR